MDGYPRLVNASATSSGRDGTFTGEHHVVVLQHGDRLTVRSLPGTAESSLTMDLTVDGPVVTGTWVEQTEQAGYYRGARYHGAIQLLAEPTGRRMRGKWLGFGKDLDINSGPWVDVPRRLHQPGHAGRVQPTAHR